MEAQHRLEGEVARRNLLEHPFYRAWTDGTLPVAALATYAAEYGAFIGVVAEGWETLGETDHADEERHHTELWQQFAAGLGTAVGGATLPAVEALVASAQECFSDPAEAVGALYAFERQQPATAASKLAGLEAWYDLPDSAHTYFRVHADNDYEADMLADHLSGLDRDEQDRAVAACGRVSEALWDALTDVHERHPTDCPS